MRLGFVHDLSCPMRLGVSARFLAFHHFTRCRSETCPMKDGSGKSVLDHMIESLDK